MFFVDENTGRWVAQGMAVTDKTKDYSSEFCRGFRFQAEVGMGIKDIGRPTESFLGSLGGMLTFTFAPRNSVLADAGREECNGRFRIGLGLTESYVDQTGVLQALVRMEYKLKDLKDPLFTLGNIKAIVQGALGIDKNYDAIAVGVGAEISVIGFNLLVGIGDAEMHSMIQTSLVYHF